MTYRFIFEKQGTASFISHLELGKVIERSFRRAAVVVKYSEGFNPHMKMSFGPALALGCESNGEYIDIRLPESSITADLLERVNCHTPIGVRFISYARLPEQHKSLGNFYNLARYEARLNLTAAEELVFEQFISSNEWIFEKISPKGRKNIDVKALLVEPPLLRRIDANRFILQYAILLNLTGGTIKPADFIKAIFGNSFAHEAQYLRVELCNWS